MADDDKTADERKPVEASAAAAKSAAPPRAYGRSSEWTASDSRGPLEKAEDGEEPMQAEEPPPHETGALKPGSQALPFSSSSHAGFGPKPESDASVATRVDSPPASHEAPNAAAATPGAADIAPDSVAKPQRRSLWPVAAAVVLGAVVGAGSAYFAHGYMDEGLGQGPQVASLSARVDALEKRPDLQAAVAKVESSLAALSNKVASLQSGAGPTSAGDAAASAPAAQAAPPAGQPAETAQAAAPDLGPMNQKIAALQAGLDGLKARGADTKGLQEKVAALAGALAGMKTAIAAAQAGVTTVQGEQQSLAGRVTMPALAVVANSLVQQVDLGQPFAAQLDALVALNADPAKIAVLRQNAEKGVPSAKTLAAKFEPLAEPIEVTAQKPPPNAGFLDRLKRGLFSMVSIRRADDTSGDDLPSRVARIKAALAHDDVPGAVATWEALPADAQAKGTAWGVLAKTSAEAMTAARALQHDAIVALAAKKS